MANNYPSPPVSSSVNEHEDDWYTDHLRSIKMPLNASPLDRTPVGSEGGVPSTTQTASQILDSLSISPTSTLGKLPSVSTSLPASTPPEDPGRFTTLRTISSSSTPSALVISSETTPSSTLAGSPWVPGEASTYGALDDLRPGMPPLFITIAGIAILWAIFFAWAVWHLWQDDGKKGSRPGHSHYRGPMELDVLPSLKKQRAGEHQADTDEATKASNSVSEAADKS